MTREDHEARSARVSIEIKQEGAHAWGWSIWNGPRGLVLYASSFVPRRTEASARRRAEKVAAKLISSGRTGVPKEYEYDYAHPKGAS